MNFFKNLKNNIARGAKNNLSLAVYAIIIAILAWFIITMTLYPSVPKTIENIAVEIDISGTAAADNGLSVISCDVEKVSVRIKGSRTQVGNLDSGSLVAYIDASNVTTSGRKTLNIKVKSDSGIKYEVESVTPPTASVVFDKYDTVEFPVSPKLPNVTFAEGKTVYNEEFTCEPEIISITGPSSQLEKISRCYAVSQREMTLDSTYVLSSDSIELYSEDNAIIDQSMLKFNTSSFNINIPVLTQKTVRLGVGIIDAPSNFDEDSLKFNFSPESITIASKNGQATFPDPLEIGTISLGSLDIGYIGTFDVNKILPNGMVNQSGVDIITVSLDDSGLKKREITLDQDNIRISNVPEGDYDYSIVTKQLTITIIGPDNVIDDISSADFTATANLLGLETSMDQFTYPVTISCSKYRNVWAVARYNILIQRTDKPDDDVTPDTEE